MNNQIVKLKEIEAKAQAVANRIDVNCEEDASLYRDIARLANELGCIINAIEVPQGN